jgi:hypothetical protein
LYLAKRFLFITENLFVGQELTVAVMSSCWTAGLADFKAARQALIEGEKVRR